MRVCGDAERDGTAGDLDRLSEDAVECSRAYVHTLQPPWHCCTNLVLLLGRGLLSGCGAVHAADVNSIVRFYKDARSGRAWLTDMQGNNVTLRASPKVFCNLTIVPLSRVLMSGSFFASLDDALRLHPRLRTAHMLWQRAGGLGGPGSSSLDGVTVFAPVDAAFKASKQDVVSLSKDEARALLQAHSLKGGAGLRSLAQLQPGAKATLLTGSSSLKLDVATK